MTSHKTERFRNLLDALPASVQRQARQAYQLWKRDSSHSSLHFRALSSNPEYYSVRVSASYRAVGRRHGDNIIWFLIGSHSDYDHLIKHL